MEAPFVKKTEISVGQHLKEQISVIGENIQASPGSKTRHICDDCPLSISCMAWLLLYVTVPAQAVPRLTHGGVAQQPGLCAEHECVPGHRA